MFFTNNKRAISQRFGTVTLTNQSGIYLLNVNNRNTKNSRARYDMCLKLTARTSEPRQLN